MSQHIAALLLAPWLGHGRMTEMFLSTVCAIYALLLLALPHAAFDSQAVEDLAWQGWGPFLSIPFIGKAVFTGLGLWCNITGRRLSQPLRFIGAFIGCVIWIWFAAKFVAIGKPASLGFPFALVAAILSVRIMAMALLNLPAPRAPGRVD